MLTLSIWPLFNKPMFDHINTILLVCSIFNGLIITGLLVFRAKHHLANIVLAFYVMLLSVRVIVYLLGKEHLYDPYSWLYLPPLEVSLAYGPCIYLYLKALLSRSLSKLDWLHLTPFVCQVSYYSMLMFVVPLGHRADALALHMDWIRHLESFLVTLSMGSYLLLSWFSFGLYRQWSNDQFSDSDNYRLAWLRSFLGMTSTFFLLWVISAVSHVFISSSFSSQFYLFAAQALLLCFLSFESWRHSHFEYPAHADLKADIASISWLTANSLKQQKHKNENSRNEPKLHDQAHSWLASIEKGNWWQEQEISLATVAKRLGTNTSSLSRAINTLSNENFNSLINRLRIQYVCDRLSERYLEQDILELAFEAGFNSKNSFNRNFKRFVGKTPSQYRLSMSTK